MSEETTTNPRDSNSAKSLLSRVRRYVWLLYAVWTAAIAGTFLWGVHQQNMNFREASYNEALAHLKKDEAIRLWATSHQRIYVPTDSTVPSPYLKYLPERDIKTPSGRELTVISHAYIVQQIHDGYKKLYGVTGHLTSRKLARAEYAPDVWEMKALEAFGKGQSEVHEFTVINGIPHLRIMRRVMAEEKCLSCHARQGYSAGEVRGGVSLMLPLGERVSRRNRLSAVLGISHFLIWAMGIAFIRLGSVKLGRGLAERENAEKALKESEERYRRISASVTDYTYSVSVKDGRNVDITHTPTCVAVTGYTSGEFSNTPSLWLDIIHPDDRDLVLKFTEGLFTGVKGRAIEYRIKHRNGAWRYVVNHPLLHFDREGNLVAYEGLVRDVTEQKEIELSLFQSQKMQSIATLAGGIAHDFNNMMTGVLGYAELLKDKLSGNQANMDMLEQIGTSARRAGDLAQQLLAYARGGKYQPKLMSLDEAITETLNLQTHAFPPAVITRRRTSVGLWSIKADPTQMQQVIMNLCINSVEAMGYKGRLEIETCNVDVDSRFSETHLGLVPGKYVCLRVSDTGPGMDQETMSRVYEPFFTTKAHGRGLGLSAVYGIVKNHGGHIFITSTRGSGTTFELYFPALSGEPPAVEPDRDSSLPGGTETVLMIDDEEAVRSVSTISLKNRGFTVLDAEDGSKAVEMASGYEGRIHLTLLDIGLPGMAGDEVFLNLRKLQPDMKFIIISGYGLDKDARHLLDLGASAFLQKPFSPNDLINLVRRTLDAK